MKIAIYQPRVSYYVGGGEIIPLQMATHFSKHNHEVTIVTSCHPKGNSEYFIKYLSNYPMIKIVYLELPGSLKWIYKEKPGTNQLRWDYEAVHMGRLAQSFFEKNIFDILNIHYNVDILAANYQYPTIMFLHGVPEETEYYDKIWFSFPNVKYVSVSKYIGQKWSNMVGGLKYNVFTNGIDSKRFHPIQMKKDIDILYFGRLIPNKGVNYLIEAVKILLNKGYTPKVTIAGEGNQQNTLEKQVKTLNLSKNISFLGYVPQEKVLKLYNRSKIFVSPSFTREGILTTILEASACSVPTITTNSCSMPEFIEHGKNGLLAIPKNSNSLASEIEKLLSNTKLFNKLCYQARKRLNYGTGIINQKILKIILNMQKNRFALFATSGNSTIKVTFDDQKLRERIVENDFMFKYIPELAIHEKLDSNNDNDAIIHFFNKTVSFEFDKYPEILIGIKSLSEKDIISLIELVFERARQEKGVYCIHSSAVVFQGKVVIFWGGASGMGKTRLARLFSEQNGKFYSDEKTLINLRTMEAVGGIPYQYLCKDYWKKQLIKSNKSPYYKAKRSFTLPIPLSLFIYGFAIDNAKTSVELWSAEKFEWHLYEELGRKVRSISRRVNNGNISVPSIDSQENADRRIYHVQNSTKIIPCYSIQGSTFNVVNTIKELIYGNNR